VTIFNLSDAGFTALDAFVSDERLIDEAIQRLADHKDVTPGEMEALVWLGLVLEDQDSA